MKVKDLLDTILQTSINYGFPGNNFMLRQIVYKLRQLYVFFGKFFVNPRKRGKHPNSKNIEDFREVQWQNYSKVAKVSLKSFVSKKQVIEFYTNFVEDLESML